MNIVAVIMLSVCPKTRMVALVPDAIPYSRLLTDPIIAFVFGDENKPKPSPSITNSEMI